MQLLQVVALCMSIAATSVHSAAVPGTVVGITPRDAYVTEADLQLRQLEKRDLPPCGKKWVTPGGQDPPQNIIDDAGYCMSHSCPKYKKGWKHEICGYRYENCIRLDVGVTLKNDGFHKQGHWYGEDGTQLVAFRYWQEQIVFRGPNGSGKVYLAHGSTWTCVKGQMNAYLEDAHETLYGNSKDNWDQVWGGPCKCYFDLSTDMGFYVAH
ncbi:hypothetical protein SMMN14_07987 [Sphaerulina musiva]